MKKSTIGVFALESECCGKRKAENRVRIEPEAASNLRDIHRHATCGDAHQVQLRGI